MARKRPQGEASAWRASSAGEGEPMRRSISCGGWGGVVFVRGGVVVRGRAEVRFHTGGTNPHEDEDENDDEDDDAPPPPAPPTPGPPGRAPPPSTRPDTPPAGAAARAAPAACSTARPAAGPRR